jgi:hypothetical protein
VGTPAIGIAVLAPVALLIVAAARSTAVRTAALGIPLAVLVAIHAQRLLGVVFLLLLDDGRLTPTFALTAGWGDIAIGAAALPVAWAIHRHVTGWRAIALVWNVAGFADLVTAVTLGVGSAPGSPIRFIFESSSSNAIVSLPWVLIPAVLVPLYLITHIAIFVQLARAMGVTRHKPHGDLLWDGTAR